MFAVWQRRKGKRMERENAMENHNATLEALLPESNPRWMRCSGTCESLAEGCDAHRLPQDVLPEASDSSMCRCWGWPPSASLPLVRSAGHSIWPDWYAIIAPNCSAASALRREGGKPTLIRLMFDLGEGVFVVYDMLELLVYAPQRQGRRQGRHAPETIPQAGSRKARLQAHQCQRQLAHHPVVTVDRPRP